MKQRTSVKDRITPEQQADLIERRTTYAALARTLECSQGHLSRCFPDRKHKETHQEIVKSKQKLAKCRREYRESLAKEHLNGKYDLMQVSKLANVSPRHMRRIIQDVKDKAQHS